MIDNGRPRSHQGARAARRQRQCVRGVPRAHSWTRANRKPCINKRCSVPHAHLQTIACGKKCNCSTWRAVLDLHAAHRAADRRRRREICMHHGRGHVYTERACRGRNFVKSKHRGRQLTAHTYVIELGIARVADTPSAYTALIRRRPHRVAGAEREHVGSATLQIDVRAKAHGLPSAHCRTGAERRPGRERVRCRPRERIGLVDGDGVREHADAVTCSDGEPAAAERQAARRRASHGDGVREHADAVTCSDGEPACRIQARSRGEIDRDGRRRRGNADAVSRAHADCLCCTVDGQACARDTVGERHHLA